MGQGQGPGISKVVIGLLLLPGVFIAFMLSFAVISDTTSRAEACSGAGPALVVDPASVPAGPIAGYVREQLLNAAQIMLAAQKLSLSVRDQQIGVMTAMGESSLQVLDRGDAVGPDSRGLFQQRDNGAWGSYSDRMNPFISATNFFKVEQTVPGRESLAPTLVAHAVQRNRDSGHYAQFWSPAVTVVQALGGVKPAAAGPPSSQSRYALGQVQPQTVTVANTVGPKFRIKTVGGYRPSAQELSDPQGHPSGLALDFMINDIPNSTATGEALAAYLKSQASSLGVKYVMWRQKIWSVDRADQGWRLMSDRSSPGQNYLDRVHVSLTGQAAAPAPGCDPGGGVGPVSLSGWAAPAKGPMTSDFGPRVSPGAGASTDHKGIDLGGGGCDGPIWAANRGRVLRAGPVSGYGNLIEIDHGDGLRTRYGHMFTIGVLVTTGQQVSAGQQIGKVGTTGNSTGCHLHFEVLKNGQPTDPQAFLAQVGVTIKQ